MIISFVIFVLVIGVLFGCSMKKERVVDKVISKEKIVLKTKFVDKIVTSYDVLESEDKKLQEQILELQDKINERDKFIAYYRNHSNSCDEMKIKTIENNKEIMNGLMEDQTMIRYKLYYVRELMAQN